MGIGSFLRFSFTCVVGWTAVVPQGRAASRELSLAVPLTQELNSVLRAGDALHKSLVRKDEEQIEMNLRDMIWQLNRAKSAVTYAKLHERGHLVRILEACQGDFEMAVRAVSEDRRGHLEGAFNQLANLARIYRLDRSYLIYFCPKDRTTWIQKGMVGSSPFRPEGPREHCGIRVTK